jgi:flavodoxin
MKAIIIFYSFSGNTKRACLFLEERLKQAGAQVDLIDLRPQKEPKKFFQQCLQAGFKKTPKLAECNYEARAYDFIIFASPVWAFTIAPALRSYLNKINDLGQKRVVCVLTFVSGTGKNKALKELEDIVRNKNGYLLFSQNIKGDKTNQADYLNQELKVFLEAIKG